MDAGLAEAVSVELYSYTVQHNLQIHCIINMLSIS